MGKATVVRRVVGALQGMPLSGFYTSRRGPGAADLLTATFTVTRPRRDG